jgi:Protein of unknown function (DUF2608)
MINMFKFIFTLLIIFSLQLDLPATILQTNHVEEIAALIDSDTLALFDVDDTLIQSSAMLGSTGWKKYVRSRILQLGLSARATETFAILSYAVFQHLPQQPVDPQLPQLIAQLQEQKIPVFGLTARGRTNWYDVEMAGIDLFTHHHLTGAGFDFTKSSPPDGFERSPDFAYGVLFSAQKSKGPALLDFLKASGYLPAKIVFIDDKLEQVESVITALESVGIPCIGIHYTAAVSNAKPFNPLIANMQLMMLFHSEGQFMPSDEEVANSITPVDELFATQYLDTVICISAASTK